MRLLNGENKQAAIYLLPDYIINNRYKLRYMGAKYERKVLLKVIIKYKGREIILKECKNINMYSLIIEKYIDNEVKEEVELFLGTKKENIKKACNLIKKHQISFEHVETILEDEFNMPCIKCYDKLIEKKAHEIIYKYLKDNNCTNKFINKAKITIEKEFKDNIELF